MSEKWDLEADVVVIGSGATGLPAAIRSRDQGASVIVVEANYDIGGHAILNGGNVPLGGGTFAFATTKNTSKILTDVGAGIVIEKTPKDAIDIIQKRIEVLEQSQKNLTTMSQQIQQQMNEVSMKAEQMLAGVQQ